MAVELRGNYLGEMYHDSFRIILPEGNRKDIRDIPEEIRHALK